MNVFRKSIDFLIHGSVIVAASVFALVQATTIRMGLPYDPAVSWFAFFGTVVGYNFVKYDAIARAGKPKLSLKMKAFIALSFLSFLATGFFFFRLERFTQIVSVAVLGITALYTLPFFPNRKTARDWAGLKIYFVALSWVGVTVALPVLNSGAALTTDFYVMCVQRFILIVVLLFIFEIIDLAWDDPHLKTVPQQIGVGRTKWLGALLMVVLLALDLLKTHNNESIFWCNIAFGLSVVVCLFFANETRGKYYTMLFVESLTIWWWLAMEWTIR
ncbi:hypothetical protein HUK80_07635 [Flavobacterium sp. MAH-1]|uniref:Prenyltransferase n=2 Tax=Flavobacterium agri TaxID=2743471 RepID=A0A7Y8Y1J3_9FLAO|nr:hypothetical protein [Flavobacterium agri]NUY80758.1 hypothetical protein [Flavobacterium agri]NYA70782.1 hypothetical protein [Flavobacterium agri]